MIKKKEKLKGTLWAEDYNKNDGSISFLAALLFAFIIQVTFPLLVFFVDWSFLPNLKNPPPIPVISVKLDRPPPSETKPIPETKKKKKPKPKKLEKMQQLPLETIQELPNELPSKIALPKPKPKPKPMPEPEKEEVEQLPPLPSVFKDIKPVRKVKPKYPRHAEEKKIEGRVKVRLKVELDGTVSKADIIFSEPTGVFDEVVLKAVKQYIFKKDGTSFFANQEIIFKLDP